jgi:hypothetical protein
MRILFRVAGELVVGEHVGALLCRIEVGEAQGWHAFQAEQLGGLDPAVAGDDLAARAEQHWVDKAEPPDAVRDLPDLLPGMGSRIPRIRA